MIVLYAFLWMYLLFIGFLAYAAAKHSWNRLKIGIKVLIIPAFLCFGIVDVMFNLVVGSILFLELPRTLTFSQRCSAHLHEAGWRGSVAGAFAVVLNAADPNHVR